MNYNSYKAEDFAVDESFISYYHQSSQEHVAFWESWIVEHPEKVNEIKQAFKLIELLTWHGSEIKFQRNLEKLKTHIGFEDTSLSQVQLTQSIEKKLNWTVSWFSMTGVAATIIILLGIGFGIYRYQHTREINNTISVQAVDIAPGGNKATLTLADGRKINLNEAVNGTLAEQAGIKITKTEDGMLVYSVNKQDVNNAQLTVEHNIIQTPKGGQYQVNLSDGTKVWLNAASSIRYPNLFKGKERKVEITGEAYFEVAKNAKMPFKVLVNNQSEVEVLGTHFNINGYLDEETVRTTLIEGSVRVSSLSPTIKSHQTTILKPGQQSQINKVSGDINVAPADIEEAVAWKNGDFIFKKQPLTQILKAISRWYSVEIEYETNQLSQQTFSGVISRSKNLSAVLEILESTDQISFKIEGNKIKVKNK
ncbi:fec operon regulator FecR [compost metagenome]